MTFQTLIFMSNSYKDYIFEYIIKLINYFWKVTGQLI